MHVIEINDVSKQYKLYYDKGSSLKEKLLFAGRSRYERHTVLKHVSFCVDKGESVGLIGVNGCGKSTLLKLIARIIYPNEGSIITHGRVSSLIELGAGFHPDMTGRENIYTNASIFGLTHSEIAAKVDSIIDFSELGDAVDAPVRTYSSGMYMRLAFSVAIHVDADILLIDEILAVGDQGFQSKCIQRMKEAKEAGTTILIVSHALGQIEDICGRTIWLSGGSIQMDGPSKAVHESYLQSIRQ